MTCLLQGFLGKHMYAGYVRIGRSRCCFASKGRDPKKKAMNARGHGHGHGHGRTNTTRTMKVRSTDRSMED